MDKPNNIRNMSVIAHGVYLNDPCRSSLKISESRSREVYAYRLTRFESWYHRSG